MKLEQKLRGIVAKARAYKYAILILLLGVGLMLLPQGKKVETSKQSEPVSEAQPVPLELEDRLEEVLSHMEGIGRVKVLLTLDTGISYAYQTDIQTHIKLDDTEEQKKTVLASDGTGREVPVTIGTACPTYRGALILCQGANSPSVRLDIIKAVSDLTGLSSDKISVIKMKGN